MKEKFMKDRLTVLFPINVLTVGGAEQQLLELVKLLDKRRFEPIVLALAPGGPLEPEFKAVPDVELISLKRKGRFDFSCLFSIIRIIRKRNVDIVQPFLTPANLFGLLAGFLCRTPVKIMTRRPGVEPKDVSFGYHLYFKAETFLARFVDIVVPNSEAGRVFMTGKGVRPERIRVIPNGLNLTRLMNDRLPLEEARRKINLPLNARVIGTVGRLAPKNAHTFLIQAAALVKEKMPDVKFALVGDGPLRASLENQAKELGVSDSVIFFGERRNIGIYFSAFDVAVLTSRLEGCSNCLIEAMAMGKPVVATAVDGNREIVEHGQNGLLVPFGNPEAVAEAILTLIDDLEAADIMGQRANELIVDKFSLEKMVNEYQSLYEEVFRQKQGRKGLLTVGQSKSETPSV
jgi:glycosyltransferase involved in cell wall biosynthesis